MIYYLIGVILGLVALHLIRNEIVFQARMRATRVAHDKSMKIIASGNSNSFMEPWNERESFGSYDEMLVDWSKWTYRQFYPGFEEEHD